MGGSICGIQKKERLNDIGNVIIIPKFDKNFIEEKKNFPLIHITKPEKEKALDFNEIKWHNFRYKEDNLKNNEPDLLKKPEDKMVERSNKLLSSQKSSKPLNLNLESLLEINTIIEKKNRERKESKFLSTQSFLNIHKY